MLARGSKPFRPAIDPCGVALEKRRLREIDHPRGDAPGDVSVRRRRRRCLEELVYRGFARCARHGARGGQVRRRRRGDRTNSRHLSRGSARDRDARGSVRRTRHDGRHRLHRRTSQRGEGASEGLAPRPCAAELPPAFHAWTCAAEGRRAAEGGARRPARGLGRSGGRAVLRTVALPQQQAGHPSQPAAPRRTPAR